MESDFKLVAFASNHNGNKIFCRLMYKKKTMVKGFYDFDKEKFFVIKYIESNFVQGIEKNIVKKNLIELLNIDYDWNM